MLTFTNHVAIAALKLLVAVGKDKIDLNRLSLLKSLLTLLKISRTSTLDLICIIRLTVEAVLYSSVISLEVVMVSALLSKTQ